MAIKKVSINPIVAGTIVAIFLVAIVFFGYRSLSAENIHSYDEGTPEQRAALSHSFRGKDAPPPAQR
jgi:hypothetical protein